MREVVRVVLWVVALAGALSWVGVAHAQDVTPGHDLWFTPKGGAVEDFGDVDPSIDADLPPIPADFFYPGSEPFIGVVEFQSVPIVTFDGQPTGNADTIVERLGTALLPSPGTSDTIPVEIVELKLVSSQPIVVTGSQPDQLWDLHVELDGGNPSTGSMTIERQTANGGQYSATIQVCPLFLFVEVGNPSNQIPFPFCNAVPGGQQIQVLGEVWTDAAQTPLISPLSGPDFFVVGPTQHTGPHPNADPIEQATLASAPSAGPLGWMVMSLLLAGSGISAWRRRSG